MITTKRLWIALVRFFERTMKIKMFAIAIFMSLCQVNFGYCVSEWAKIQPAGSANPGDIDALILVNNEALDRLMTYGRFNCKLAYDTASQFTVGAGSVVCSNSAGTLRRTRANTSATTVTFSSIDTGSEAASTTYYVYAVGDTDVATFTIKISTSSSAPTGVTYYKRLGSIYNDADSDIDIIVTNDDETQAVGIYQVVGTDDISTTSTSYTDMTDMTLTIDGAGEYLIMFCGSMHGSAATVGNFIIDIDGSDETNSLGQIASYSGGIPSSIQYYKTLTAGSHTIKIQWKATSGTMYQLGTKGTRILTVMKIK